jgi:hypothetical protein
MGPFTHYSKESKPNSSKPKYVMRATDLMEMTRPKDRWDANEILLGAGYELLGSGSFATVYDKPGLPYVLKLFDGDDKAYMAFAMLTKQHPNIHFPKLMGKPVKVSPGFYAIRMERLEPYRGDPHLFHVYTVNRDRKLDPDSYTASQMSDVEEIFYGDPTLKVALDIMIDNLTPQFRFDLWNQNIMMRGSTIVFTDPVANLASNQERHIIPVPHRQSPPAPPQKLDPAKAKQLADILSDDDLLRELQ